MTPNRVTPRNRGAGLGIPGRPVPVACRVLTAPPRGMRDLPNNEARGLVRNPVMFRGTAARGPVRTAPGTSGHGQSATGPR